MTALILDAREGNRDPLYSAYFDQEIDYFLDIEAPRNTVVRDLYVLRQAGKLIELGDYTSAENQIRSLKGFEDQKTYLMGALAGARGQYAQAAEYFRQLIDKRGDLSKNLSTLSFIGAARIFHEVGDYKQAIYHYTQIRPFDPQFFESVFEKAWSFYQMGDMNGALGVTLAFVSPFFENSFFPEAFIIRAAAFFQLCYFDRASLAVEKLKRDFEPLRYQIGQLIQRGPATWLFEEASLKKMNPKILGSMIADRSFRSALRAYLALRDEVHSLRGSDAQLANHGLSFVKQKLLQEAQRVLGRDEKVLRDVLAQADLIQIEILQSGANLLMGKAPEHTIEVKTIDLANVDFDELVQFWPFKGEFWLDELGSHYYGLKSKCDTN
jgi:tetratricopeptide (TPR) repeat protein